MINQYQAYKQNSVMTMTPGQILVAVFDELIKQLNIALISFESNDIQQINSSLIKSQRILNELKSTLNHEYSLSDNLNDIYNYFIRVIMNANVKKEVGEIKEILPMIVELKDAFFEADKMTR